jgi:hypothetical protein
VALDVTLPLMEVNMKSQLNDYLEVMQAIYIDACVKCAAKVSFRDLKTIRSRVEDEGLSFLTITLPDFARDVEQCLERGSIDPQLFRRFRKSGALPAFLQGMLGRVFNKETGRINDFDTGHGPYRSPISVSDLIGSIRQICLAFKKLELDCTPERVCKSMESFIENERSFNVFPLPKEDDRRFKLVSSVLWDNIIRGLRVDMLVPRHGPGHTADGKSGNRKYRWSRWHSRLEPYFPILDSCFSASAGEFDDKTKELGMVTIVHSDEEQPVKVTPVPKTLKGPRVIAIEPCCMQYAQQAISRALMKLLESNIGTAGHVNFHDQSINGGLALMSSNDGWYATIDLSDASDRVPVGYALQMFRSNPDLKDAIEACRSTTAKMPDGRRVHLRKFASMGSALCFPIEAMYFYTICVIALLELHNLPVSHSNVKRVQHGIYIYGDDILVPAYCAATVLDHLKKYNCKVNTHKTFYRGKFRESCGVDAFEGQVVTPIYLNRVQPRSRQQVQEILSRLAAANHFNKRGYRHTACLLFKQVEKVLGKLPGVPEDSPVLGRIGGWTFDPPKRVRRRFQRVEVLCWTQHDVYRTDRLDGYAALQKSLLKLEGLQSLDAPRDRFHLERSALHDEVAINRRWVPASLIAGLRE